MMYERSPSSMRPQPIPLAEFRVPVQDLEAEAYQAFLPHNDLLYACKLAARPNKIFTEPWEGLENARRVLTKEIRTRDMFERTNFLKKRLEEFSQGYHRASNQRKKLEQILSPQDSRIGILMYQEQVYSHAYFPHNALQIVNAAINDRMKELT